MITGFGEPVQPDREYYLDWLRLVAILSVFFHHVAKFFDYDSFTLYNSARSLAASAYREFNALWIMPLFFVISGAAVHFSLKSRGAGGFLKERVLRILLPLAVLGTFVINPPQVYFMRLFNGEYTGSFLAWIPHYFNGVFTPDGKGNFAPLGFGTHLWYLMYLFIFTLVLLPLFVRFGRTGKSLLARLGQRINGPWGLLLLFLPVSLAAGFNEAMGLGWMRITGGWSPIPYLLFFALGYVVFSNPRLVETVRDRGLSFLAAAAVLTWLYVDTHFGITLNIPGITRHDILNNGAVIPLNRWVLVGIMGLRGLIAWCWIVGLAGLGRRVLTADNRLLDYATEAVLPFYILHHTVMIAVGYYVIRLNASVTAKFILIAVVSFGIIMVLYHFLVRRYNALRFLFGLKRVFV